jgi:hypothetical protein
MRQGVISFIIRRRSATNALRIRGFSSSDSNASNFTVKEYQEYVRQLMKKFMFQVHPDYFLNFKVVQEVNNKNLRLLQSLVEVREGSAASPDTRSLIFYLKPDETFPEPKKVKVSTNRIIDSITEILETIGVELPDKPSEFEYYKNLYQRNNFANRSQQPIHHSEEKIVDSEALAIISFFDSIGDRRELISLREEKLKYFYQTEQVCASFGLFLFGLIFVSEGFIKFDWTREN